jgi:hypothetical protein
MAQWKPAVTSISDGIVQASASGPSRCRRESSFFRYIDCTNAGGATSSRNPIVNSSESCCHIRAGCNSSYTCPFNRGRARIFASRFRSESAESRGR